ncbi:MAG: putative DNA binding domain-containing protein [Thermomicrobiales bacterium]|nr:putative DNA binding domain-containing protein [Thermomicrobiales bacterium]
MSELDQAVKSGTAMLNGSLGGVVYIGVNDDGEIVGIELGDRSHNRMATALAKLAPTYWPETETITLDSGRVVLGMRFPGNSGIYRYQGRPFVRIGASNHELSEDQYQKKVLERFHSVERWELKNSGLAIEHLNTGLLTSIVESAIKSGRLADPNTRDPAALLQGFGLLSDGQINNAAAALLGKPEFLEQKFPQCRVRLARFEGVTKNLFRDNRQFTGNIFDLLRISMSFVAEHNPVRSEIVSDQIQRVDTPLYSPDVVREALVNAFTHRDYAEPSGAVDVAIYDDRMEIVSTGGLRFGLTVEDLLIVHQSRPWNQIIASVLQRQGIFESWGLGTTRMIERSRIAGSPDPIFLDSRHSFTVQLSRFVISTASNLSQENRILAALAEYHSMSLSELFHLLHWEGTRRQLQLVLERLRTARKVEVVGRNRGARWQLSSTMKE